MHEQQRSDKTKLTLHSNAPWVGTGYGTQTALFAPEIANAGFDVSISAFYGLHGGMRGWTDKRTGQKFYVYPSGRNAHGNDVIGAHAKHWFNGEPGIVFLLTDPWVMMPEIIKRLPAVAWTPIDHDPLIPDTDDWFSPSGAVPVAMSEFGKRVLEEAGHEALYVPHAFDPEVFKPREQGPCRQANDFPDDCFLVGIVAANKGRPARKGFWQMLKAFQIFQEKHKDARLYMHTTLRAADGENLSEMVRILKLRPFVVQQYLYQSGFLGASHLSNLFNAFDVTMNCAHGEGFGLPILESMACGTPVIVTNFSSMPEIVGDTGWKVDGQMEWTQFDSNQMCPDIEGIVHALELAYGESKEERAARMAATVEQAWKYEISRVSEEYLKPALEEAVDLVDWQAQQTEKL